MKILLINPPYMTLTSRFGTGHQIPLGLLRVGGPLIEAGHDVRLLDAERRHLTLGSIVEEVKEFSPEIVMTGHAGSTPAHPICVKMLTAIKHACPEIVSIYGGVYPTFHAQQILEQEEAVDVIVRGEGEEIYTREELVERFDLSAVGKSGAVFDHEKLEWMNGIYIRNLNLEDLTSRLIPILERDLPKEVEKPLT